MNSEQAEPVTPTPKRCACITGDPEQGFTVEFEGRFVGRFYSREHARLAAQRAESEQSQIQPTTEAEGESAGQPPVLTREEMLARMQALEDKGDTMTPAEGVLLYELAKRVYELSGGDPVDRPGPGARAEEGPHDITNDITKEMARVQSEIQFRAEVLRRCEVPGVIRDGGLLGLSQEERCWGEVLGWLDAIEHWLRALTSLTYALEAVAPMQAKQMARLRGQLLRYREYMWELDDAEFLGREGKIEGLFEGIHHLLESLTSASLGPAPEKEPTPSPAAPPTAKTAPAPRSPPPTLKSSPGRLPGTVEVEAGRVIESLNREATANVPEFVSETFGPSCDVCGKQYAVSEWNGSLLCQKCLEEELENDHTIPEEER